MRGKEKCKALKEIRRQIAQENDIAYAVSECSYQGECKGTCPKCEAELRYLERELERRKNLGKAVCVVGISTAVCSGLTACNPAESVRDVINNVFHIGVTEETAGVAPAPEQLTGDVEMAPEPSEIPEEDIDGGIMPPEETEVPVPEVVGEIEIPMPTPEAILPKGMGEGAEETMAPEELAGKIMVSPSPEILEGDIAIVEELLIVDPVPKEEPTAGENLPNTEE